MSRDTGYLRHLSPSFGRCIINSMHNQVQVSKEVNMPAGAPRRSRRSEDHVRSDIQNTLAMIQTTKESLDDMAKNDPLRETFERSLQEAEATLQALYRELSDLLRN